MKITYVLPSVSLMPIGGFKIIYEYANRLTKRGHIVNIIHPKYIDLKIGCNITSLKLIFKYLLIRIVFIYRRKPWSWFDFDNRVRICFPLSLEPLFIPNSDIIVATFWNTAPHVVSYPPIKGRKYYFIQGLDTIFYKEENYKNRIKDTWSFPLKKIVISHWLEEIMQSVGEDCFYIPNAIDFEKFDIDVSIESRNNNIICLINNELEFKGTADGLQALHLVREDFSDIKVFMFGISRQPEKMPNWITYYQNPTQKEIRDIYNKSAIFIGPSWSEGFGLPGCEAAACGTALCLADNGGHREYAIHNETALLYPPRNFNILAEHIISLLNDNQKRIRFARNANEYVKRFTWDRAVEQMEKVFSLAAAEIKES